jgi:hypothetical protein
LVASAKAAEERQGLWTPYFGFVLPARNWKYLRHVLLSLNTEASRPHMAGRYWISCQVADAAISNLGAGPIARTSQSSPSPDAFENPSAPEDHLGFILVKTRPLGLGQRDTVCRLPFSAAWMLILMGQDFRDGDADAYLFPLPFPFASPRSGSSDRFPVVQATPDQK